MPARGSEFVDTIPDRLSAETPESISGTTTRADWRIMGLHAAAQEVVVAAAVDCAGGRRCTAGLRTGLRAGTLDLHNILSTTAARGVTARRRVKVRDKLFN